MDISKYSLSFLVKMVITEYASANAAESTAKHPRAHFVLTHKPVRFFVQNIKNMHSTKRTSATPTAK